MATPRYKVLSEEKVGVDLPYPEELDFKAPNMFFDPTVNGFTSDNVQDAINEARKLADKSGKLLHTDFSGSPKKATVTFSVSFPDANYSVSIVGADGRCWIAEAQTGSSFTINAQAKALLTGPVQWTAIYNGESPL